MVKNCHGPFVNRPIHAVSLICARELVRVNPAFAVFKASAADDAVGYFGIIAHIQRL
jgi:hypothetical protein